MMDADRLDDLLAARGWTRKDLAAAAGMTESTLSRIIQTDRHVQPRTRARITRALGVRGWEAANLFDYHFGGATP